MGKIEFTAECYKRWLTPFTYRLKNFTGGVSIEIDTDIQFPMCTEDMMEVQPGKKYKITIEEVEYE